MLLSMHLRLSQQQTFGFVNAEKKNVIGVSKKHYRMHINFLLWSRCPSVSAVSACSGTKRLTGADVAAAAGEPSAAEGSFGAASSPKHLKHLVAAFSIAAACAALGCMHAEEERLRSVCEHTSTHMAHGQVRMPTQDLTRRKELDSAAGEATGRVQTTPLNLPPTSLRNLICRYKSCASQDGGAHML